MIASAGKYLFSGRYDSAMEESSQSVRIATILRPYVTGLIVYDPRHNVRFSRSGNKDGFKPAGYSDIDEFGPVFHKDA